MISFLEIVYNFFWILGLAILLSGFSLAHWQATQQKRLFRYVLSKPYFHLTLIVGLILFALGFMLTVEFWLYKIGWVGLIILSVALEVIAWRGWFNSTK